MEPQSQGKTHFPSITHHHPAGTAEGSENTRIRDEEGAAGLEALDALTWVPLCSRRLEWERERLFSRRNL